MKKYERDEETGQYKLSESPTAKEIESIIMMQVLYDEFIVDDAEFVLRLKRNMSVADDDTRLLNEAGQAKMPAMVNYIVEKGMANYSLIGKLKEIWAS